ncbi:Melibiase-domain-containing protein [Phycomyces nitens]|nr:Melibiase-domain-containing protein [Phycomyces nitens]
MLPLGVSQNPSSNTWYIVSKKSTYVIGVTPEGVVINLHWGGRLYFYNDVPAATLPTPRSSQDPALTAASEEMPAYGGLRYGAIGLKAEIELTQTRELDLLWKEASFKTNQLNLVLCDKAYPLFSVELVYSVDIENDVISRHTIIRNQSEIKVHLSKAYSAVWHLPSILRKRKITTLTGAWAAETQAETQSLGNGTLMLESRRGIPSCQTYPYVAVQDQEEVYFGTLAWSGSWAIEVHSGWDGKVAIAGGVHEHDFGWSLFPKETYETPVFVAGYSATGLSGARSSLTNHVRLLQRNPTTVNPIVFNSWETTQFEASYENQLSQATKAAAIGVELFVLDDGWFRGRTSDRSGLGDWFADPVKFPQGLKPLADQVHRLGMKFGLWFEPEMVNRDSDLFRAHPSWIYHYSDRKSSEARNQLVLNITLSEVEEYVYKRISETIRQVGVDYIKWDMNRPLSEVTMATYRDSREVWTRHVQTWYRLLKRLRNEFPLVLVETCSSGGGRADIGALGLTDMCWPSDNTRPDARLVVQHGISHALPPRVLGCWVTEGLAPLSYRFHTAFMGNLGIGCDLGRAGVRLEDFKDWLDIYKSLRRIVQLGNLDWLVGPGQINITATSLEDQVVVLVLREHSPYGLLLPPVRIQGLEASYLYRVHVWSSDPKKKISYTISGACAMQLGLSLDWLSQADYGSGVMHLKRIIL